MFGVFLYIALLDFNPVSNFHRAVIMTVFCLLTAVYHLKVCPSSIPAMPCKLFYLFYLARGIIRAAHL